MHTYMHTHTHTHTYMGAGKQYLPTLTAQGKGNNHSLKCTDI